MDRPRVLGLETSCDETSAAVLQAPGSLLGHVVLSQDVHEVYGEWCRSWLPVRTSV